MTIGELPPSGGDNEFPDDEQLASAIEQIFNNSSDNTLLYNMELREIDLSTTTFASQEARDRAMKLQTQILNSILQTLPESHVRRVLLHIYNAPTDVTCQQVSQGMLDLLRYLSADDLEKTEFWRTLNVLLTVSSITDHIEQPEIYQLHHSKEDLQISILLNDSLLSPDKDALIEASQAFIPGAGLDFSNPKRVLEKVQEAKDEELLHERFSKALRLFKTFFEDFSATENPDHGLLQLYTCQAIAASPSEEPPTDLVEKLLVKLQIPLEDYQARVRTIIALMEN